MEIWLEIALVVATAYLIWFFIALYGQQRKNIEAVKRATPIGEKHPIWGNFHLLKDLSELPKLTKQVVQKTHSKLLVVWNLRWPTFVTTHPDTAKVLLKSLAPKPFMRGSAYHPLLPMIDLLAEIILRLSSFALSRHAIRIGGKGLLLSEGKKWERNRRLLTPAFHFDVLRPYMKIYNQVAETFLDKLWTSSSDGKKSIEIYEPAGLAALDTVLRCALSYEGNVQEQGTSHPYVQAVKNLAKLMSYRSVRPWLGFDWIFHLTASGKNFQKLCEYIHCFAENIIAKRRAILKEDPAVLKKRRLDFLDILLTAKDENGIGLTDKEIREEVDTFLFAGHDTTASGISWAMYCLAKYPDEQQRVYEEVSDVLKDRSTVEWDDIPKMKRMALFIKEVFRMYPPVTGIGRILDKPMEIGGVMFSKGSNVNISITNIHNNPDVWPDYDTFRPDRFIEDRDPYSFVPFSAGPRNCIGQNFALLEEKVILARLLNRFKLRLDIHHEVEPVTLIVLRAKNGIKIYLEQR